MAMVRHVAIAVVALGVLTGCPPPRPSSEVPHPWGAKVSAAHELPTDTIRIASFNIRVFGKAKRRKPEVMAILVDVVRKYDLVAIQEIKDASGDTPSAFLAAINARPGPDYAMVVSPRTGVTASSSSQEQYAYVYNPDTVVSLDAGALYPDPSDAFVREPWVARFKAADGNFSFVLLDIHTRPDAAVAEVGALHDAIAWARLRYAGEDDFIALGDYNASCRYATVAKLDALELRGADYTWLVPDDADTNLAPSTCAYDRIVATSATRSDYAAAWGVDRAFTDEAVSDHWPVWADFFTHRDAPPR